MGKATAAAMMAETNALVEGGDVVEEQEREPARVPLAMDEIYRRLDRELRCCGWRCDERRERECCNREFLHDDPRTFDVCPELYRVPRSLAVPFGSHWMEIQR